MPSQDKKNSQKDIVINEATKATTQAPEAIVESNKESVTVEIEAIPNLIEVPKIKPETASMAKSVGIDVQGIFDSLDKINGFYKEQKEFQRAVVQAFEEIAPTIKQLAPLVQLAKQAQEKPETATQTAQSAPMADPKGLMDILSVIGKVMGTEAPQQNILGFNSNEINQYILESFRNDLAIGKAIKNQVMQKLGATVAQNVLDEKPSSVT